MRSSDNIGRFRFLQFGSSMLLSLDGSCLLLSCFSAFAFCSSILAVAGFDVQMPDASVGGGGGLVNCLPLVVLGGGPTFGSI